MIIIKKIPRKHLSDIENISEDDKLIRIIKGIYLIENYYRNTFLRVCEYIFLVLNFLLNKVFGITIKNLTVGHFQLGITSILTYYGYQSFDIHAKWIKAISFKQLICILKGIKWKNNLEICVWKIEPLFYQLLLKNSHIDSLSGNIGEYYNGKMSYGFLLQRLVYEI